MILAVIQASMLRISPARLREPILLPPSPGAFQVRAYLEVYGLFEAGFQIKPYTPSPVS